MVEQFAAEALSIALRIGDSQTEMLASSTLATAGLLLGRPRPDHMARALHLAATTASPRLGRTPEGAHGRHCLWCGRLAEARVIIREAYDECVRTGAEFQRPFRILDLANLEVAVGHLAAATELAEEGMEAAGDAGNRQAQAWLAYPHGVAQAHLGHADRSADARGTAPIPGGRAGRTHAARDGRTRTRPAGPRRRSAGAGRRPSSAGGRPRTRDRGEAALGRAGAARRGRGGGARRRFAARAPSWRRSSNEQAAAVGQPWVDAAALRGRGLAALAAGHDEAADLLAGGRRGVR